MLNFKYLRWKNFLSTGNAFTEIKLDRSPNTLVVGDNGAGKSTMTDALCFALYGKPFRKIKKDQLVNSINQRDAVVEVEFEAYKRHYKIVRGVKPHIFEIYQDGILVNQTAAIKDYQEILERTILRMNLKSFTQIVILGSSSFVPFMQLPAGVRREVIEDLLDIRVFSTMSSLLKDKISDNKTDLTLTDNNLMNNKRVLEIQQSHLENMQKRRQEEIDQIEMRIAELEEEVEKSNTRIKQFEEQLRELDAFNSDSSDIFEKQTEIDNLLQKMANKLKNAQKGIEFYNNNEHCPTCTQPIDVTVRTLKLGEKHTLTIELTKAIAELQEKQEKHKVKIKEFNTKQVDYNNIIKIQNDLMHMRTVNEREIVSLQKRIAQYSQAITIDLEEQVENLKKELSELIARKDKLHEDSMLYGMASVILRDGGIKSRILKQYIPIINTLVNKYLAAMDFFVKFELNEQFEERILSRHRDDFTYDSFSEGEKMRIDLALLFTWRTVARMKNSANTNLLILDEVFDASLDANGCDEFLKLIQSLDNVNVFVISHKGDILQDKFRSSIRFEKHSNFSRIAAP